ncbi:unnamed protein product [Acidithrix sp. C25]|nr:unnamed protein product [Acidithrix sp. C25]
MRVVAVGERPTRKGASVESYGRLFDAWIRLATIRVKH